MRLLNTKSYQLHSCDQNVPPYAILSHTWGDEEVTFDDIASHHRGKMKGWTKVVRSCNRAAEDGWEYIWIDTCCIDKTNSSELGEAINSMFHWYEEAQICIAYLADVRPRNSTATQSSLGTFPWGWYFRSSRWFRRGWTLQELLAPTFLLFLDGEWGTIGSREQWASEVEKATGIKAKHLADFRGCSVATKLSWAANRQTARQEDRAYSLLGLLGVNMPLIYGEGGNAFIRLQHELIRSYNDGTIFAWGEEPSQSHQNAPAAYTIMMNQLTSRASGTGAILPRGPLRNSIGVLASSPDEFQYWNDLHPIIWPFDKRRRGFTLTNAGLNMKAELFEIPRNFDEGQSLYALHLNCSWSWPPLKSTRSPIVLLLQSAQLELDNSAIPSVFKRIKPQLQNWHEMSSDKWRSIGTHDIVILEHGEQRPKVSAPDFAVRFEIEDDGLTRLGHFKLSSYHRPFQEWIPYDSRSIVISNSDIRSGRRVRLPGNSCIVGLIDVFAAKSEMRFLLIIKSSPILPSVGIWKADNDPVESLHDCMEYLDSKRPNFFSVPLPNDLELQVSVIPKPSMIRAEKEACVRISRTDRFKDISGLA